MNIEFAILDWLQAHLTCPLMDWLMVFFSRIGDSGLIWIIITIILLIPKRTRRYGLTCALSLLFSLLLCNLGLKPIVMRERPFAGKEMELLVAAPQDFSFPSGHTSSSFAAATALSAHGRSWGIPAYILAVLIAFSRLYLYVHFPSDVLAGAVVGIICGILARLVIKKVDKISQKHQSND